MSKIIDEGLRYAEYCKVNFNWASRDIDRLQKEVAELKAELALNTGIADGLSVALMRQERENERLEAENKRLKSRGIEDPRFCRTMQHELAALRKTTRELADDVTAYVDAEYPEELRGTYPHIMAKFDRDMVVVRLAEALLLEVKDD